MPEQSTQKQEVGDTAATPAGQSADSKENATKDQTKKGEKKKGFFAKWRDSTADAYDKHRASGGTL